MKSVFDFTLVPASGRQRAVALAVTIALGLTTIAVLPVLHTMMGASFGYVPAIGGAMVVANGVTAALMLRQAVLSRRPSLLVLSFGFAFIGCVIVPYVVFFPGFAGWTIALHRPDAASWLWTLWHAAVPGMVIAYVLRDRLGSVRDISGRAIWMVAPLTAGLAAFGVIAVSPLLPAYAIHSVWQPIVTLVIGPLMVIAIGLAAAALATRRFQSMLDVFLALTLVATAIEVVTTLASGARFSVGWYVSKIDSVVATTAVLVALLSTSGRLSGLVSDAERRMRSLVDGVADALIAVDSARKITSFNPAAHALFGYARADIGDLTVHDVIPNFAAFEPTEARSTAVETLGKKADGTTFPIEIAFGEGVDDREARTIVIARDITQRKRSEAAIKAARDQAIASANVKADFLATMSHEIRTPINAVVGMSELLLQSELSAEAFDYAKTVRDSAEALLGIINDILDFSKIEAGKMELDARPAALVAIVESAADICAGAARAKGLSLVTHVAPDVPVSVLGDANRLRQVLINLIGNAVKFTDEGNIVVRAVVDRIVGEATVVRFSITDTGLGIAQENVESLFEAFRQVDQSARRRHGGTGLGLSISKRLVEMMNGTIGVESALGRGSTFWFAVPFDKFEDEAPSAPAAPAEPPMSLRGTRILLVVDDVVSRSIIEQYLMAWGIVATSTTNPTHALALLRAGDARRVPYDAVVVDFAMPTVDGFAFAARIRADALVAGTPLIFVSANDDVGRSAEALARGFSAYLRKPLKQSALFEALVAAVSGNLGVRPRELATPLATHDGVLVLVAEDNIVNRKLALQQLKKLGYRAHAVENGAEAVAAAAEQRYDLIFMDCQMPEVDGFEATQTIRRAERVTGRHVPIVAMTANALEGDREACLAAGMDDYLAKPVQLAALRAILERFTTTGAVGAR